MKEIEMENFAVKLVQMLGAYDSMKLMVSHSLGGEFISRDYKR